jgi:beta-phosphoglucomutase-like phosphatase (HAD superfamily)
VEAGRAGHFGSVVGVNRAAHAEALKQHGADIVVSDLAELMGTS